MKRRYDEPLTPRLDPAGLPERDRPSLTLDAIAKDLRKRDFGVLTTVGEDGRPDSVGVNYGVSLSESPFSIYVMTRRHLKKARNIAVNPSISFIVPLTRRLLWFLPPPTIRFQGQAEILDWRVATGVQVFKSFLMGRQILRKYQEAFDRGETRVCFLRITPDAEVSTYMVGYPVWEISRRMETGSATVPVPERETDDPRRRSGRILPQHGTPPA